MNRKKASARVLPLILMMCLLMAGCGSNSSEVKNAQKALDQKSPALSSQEVETPSDEGTAASDSADKVIPATPAPVRTADSYPDYSGRPYAVINDNTPEFTEADLTTTSYETYGELDSLGRCTTCIASIGRDLMPTEKRASIGSVRPTGWHMAKYDWVEGKYLYNRCHLIGYQLTAENANKQNLITGTRYLNVDGMLPFENLVADYVKETGNHVLYRVTPVFDGQNLIASGVHMEAQSVEDHGDGVMFNIYCYNIQEGVVIDYATGESRAADAVPSGTDTAQPSTPAAENKEPVPSAADSTPAPAESSVSPAQDIQSSPADTGIIESSPAGAAASTYTSTYIANVDTKKFHAPGCRAVSQMNAENKLEINGTRDEILAQGYDPCGICRP